MCKNCDAETFPLERRNNENNNRPKCQINKKKKMKIK